MENLPHFISIRELSKTGLLSEYALRMLVRQGRVPGISVGKKFLINREAFIKQLQEMKGANL